MVNRANPLTILNGTRGNKLTSLLLLSFFISLQSLLFVPPSGQNGISICQSESVRTEAYEKQSKKKDISFSFIKLFFQLGKSISDTDRRQEAWLQGQLNYSLQVNQLIRSLELPPVPRPLYLKANIPHSFLDEYHVELLS